MTSYIVMAPVYSVEKSGLSEDRVQFVKDGFSVFALILPVFWLLGKRLWWHAAVAFLVISVLTALIGQYFSLASVTSALTFLLSAFVALEGKNWYLSALQRRGFQEVAVVEANGPEEAEIRYFYGIEAADPELVITPAHSVPTSSHLHAQLAAQHTDNKTAPMIGLVDYRGRS